MIDIGVSFLQNRRVLALDIGAYRIKVVEGKKTNAGIVVSNFFTINTPKGAIKDGQILDKDILHYTIKEELKRRKIRTKNVYVTINSSKILTREIIIPKLKDEEIESLLRFQLEDHIPINIDNYVIQYKVLESFYEDDIEKINLLIISIPKDLVEGYLSLLKQLDLNPLIMDYQPNSIAKLIQYNEYINNTYPTEDITFANVDIGYDSTKISIIRNGKILVSRIIEIGGNYIDESILNFHEVNFEELDKIKLEITDLDSNSEDNNYYKLSDMIKTSIIQLSEKIDIILRYYSSRNAANNISLFLLTGGISNIKGLDNLFTNIFNMPSITIDSLDKISFKGKYADYANAIGSIIRVLGV